MSLLKQPLDYTRRCDKCQNWIPSHVTEDFEGIREGDGKYCELVSDELTGYPPKEKGYSRLVQRTINAMMETFTMCDDMFLDAEYNSQVLIAMANCCPLFDEISTKEMKKRNKRYNSQDPYLTMFGVIDPINKAFEDLFKF